MFFKILIWMMAIYLGMNLLRRFFSNSLSSPSSEKKFKRNAKSNELKIVKRKKDEPHIDVSDAETVSYEEVEE